MANPNLPYTYTQIKQMLDNEDDQDSKIAALESQSFKTINGESIKGSGNITIGEGSGSTPVVDSLDSDSTTSALSAKQGKVLSERTKVEKASFFPSGIEMPTSGDSVGGNCLIIKDCEIVNKIKLYARAAGTFALCKVNSVTFAYEQLETITISTAGVQIVNLSQSYSLVTNELFYVVNVGSSRVINYTTDATNTYTIDIFDAAQTRIRTAFYKGYINMILMYDVSLVNVCNELQSKALSHDNSIASHSTSIATNTSNISKLDNEKMLDKYAGKTIIMTGDSYAEGVFVCGGYQGLFAQLHPHANVLQKGYSGYRLGQVLSKAKTDHFIQYAKTKTELVYPIPTSASELVSCVLTTATKLETLRICYHTDNAGIRLIIHSYNADTRVCTQLYSIDVNKKYNEELYELNLLTPIYARDGETLLIACEGGGIYIVADSEHTYQGGELSNITTKSGCPQVQIEACNLDYYILEGGLNDYYQSLTLGEISEGYSTTASDYNINTFCGCVEQYLMILRRDFISTKVGVLIMPQISATWRTYAQKIIDACDKWGVPYLDLDATLGVAMRKTDTLYNTIYRDFWRSNADGTFNLHPSMIGHKLMSGEIFNFIDRL